MLAATLLQKQQIKAFSAISYFLYSGILVKTVNLLKDFNMKKTIAIIAILFVSVQLNAQVQFINSGKIEFEKKINQHAPILDEPENLWTAEMLKQMPKFVSDTYELKFTNNKSVYKLAKENPTNRYMMWGSKPVDTDAIIQDLQNANTSAQKEIFENTYVIKDSIRNLEWKIAD